jgi:uncharacterized protein (TIGR00251 family)
MGASWLRRDGPDWLLAIHAQPGARKSGVAGLHGEALKIKLSAPPSEGRANAELLRYLAEALGVPLSAVRLERGASARKKWVRVCRADIDPERLLGGLAK